MKGQKPRVVVDTNVFVAGLRSRRGWSFQLLSTLGTGLFDHVLTVPLVMEYDDVLHRPGLVPISAKAVNDILDYVCASGIQQTVHFLWRPKLADIKDDLVLEAAVNGQCQTIVTWNIKDFRLASDFGIAVMGPDLFLNRLQESSS